MCMYEPCQTRSKQSLASTWRKKQAKGMLPLVLFIEGDCRVARRLLLPRRRQAALAAVGI